MNVTAAGRTRGDLLVAFAACRQLAALVASGPGRFDTDADRRAHVRYLWIVAGSRLADCSGARGPISDGGAYSQVVGLHHKLARTAPERIDDRLLWRATQDRALVLARDIATTLETLA